MPSHFRFSCALMRLAVVAGSAVIFAAAPLAAAETTNDEAQCASSRNDLSPSRTVEIDTASGPIFGAFTKQEKEPRFLKSKEVVLTFDDGPMPWITKSILDTLDRFCTKATFFSVGRMAAAYPETMREVMARGHTLGTHTMTHPFNMHRMDPARAHREIEHGFAAVARAAGQPIAPFFRFPGLADSGPLLAYLRSRGVAAFTVDVVSNDSYIRSVDKLVHRTLAEIDRADGGIVLFHDIKSQTAKALPIILRKLKDRGYKIVHMRAADVFQPLPEATAAVSKSFKTETSETDGKPERLPFYGRIGPPSAAERSDAVDLIAPPARDRPTAKTRSRSEATRPSSEQPRSAAERRRAEKARARQRAIERKRRQQAKGYQQPFIFDW